jgi:hypothetical protein
VQEVIPEPKKIHQHWSIEVAVENCIENLYRRHLRVFVVWHPHQFEILLFKEFVINVVIYSIKS